MQRDSIKQESVDEAPTVSHNDDRKKYICDSCELTFFSRSGIRRHFHNKHLGLRTSSQKKTEICTICGAYVTKRNFKDHVNSHSTARDYKCELCGTAVKSIYTLRKHMKRVHPKMRSSALPETMIECESCDKQFSSPDRLRRHMRIHSDSKFECELCSIRFASRDFLRNHLIKHTGEWSYDCGLCSKMFKHSSSVSGHRRLHKIDGYYHCGCCADRFKDYAQLKRHFVNTNHSFCSDEN